MPRRRISFDIAVNAQSAQREADRVANIFQSRLRNIQVGTTAGRGGAGGGGTGGRSRGGGFGPFGDANPAEFLKNTAGFAVSGMFYQFFSGIPRGIQEIDALATTNRRATVSFRTLAGGVEEANAMIEAYIQGTGGVADRISATTEAMRLFNIGMAQDADQMRAFTTLSRGMSTALGRPVEYIQEQFSLALANQSQLRFDQLGLSIERHKELMADLMEQNPEMSREIAFQNAMLQQAAERYYNLANATEALATSSEVLGRQLRDIRGVWAEIFSQQISLPISALLAQGAGAEDINLPVPGLRSQANIYRNMAEQTREGGWQQIPNNILRAIQAPFEGQFYTEAKAEDISKYESAATLSDALADALNALQAAQNAGIKVTEEWTGVTNQASEALRTGSPEMDRWSQVLVTLIMQIEEAVNPTALLGDELHRTSTAAEVAQAKIEGFNSVLLGAVTGVIGKLVEAGASPDAIRSMLPSEDEIFEAATALQETALAQGDAIDREIAVAIAQEQLLSQATGWLDAAEENERAQRRAASEMSQAAQEAEKAFTNAADSIVQAYEGMLNNVEGLFGTSKVTEEDLKLAELGFGVNYPDDALRRLEDVAFNKTRRSDVDLGMWAQALGMPGDTDPTALAIHARKRWESGALWANPENIENLLNVGAVRDDLRQQEMAALGQQNLKAFFGLGTDEGKEFLRVFGMEALDPIQDGLITEITTRGPIMGSTLADAMHTGFSTRSLELPWVATIMSAIDSAVGRALLGGLNNSATSNTADAEAIPLE